MIDPRRGRRAVAVLCVILAACMFGSGCMGARSEGAAAAAAAPRPVAGLSVVAETLQDQRLLVRYVSLTLETEDPSAVGSEITRITTEAGGFVEQATATEGERVELQLRIPVAQLATVLSRVQQMGRVKERRDSARDVTEETIDVEARLASLVALRNRLRTLLQSTNGVQDVVAVERELARVQSEIDSLEGRRNYLRSHVAFAQVSIRVDRRRVLGPVGLVLAGAAWLVSKLFVIR